MRFTYRSGQRVLDGFTIKRGVGKGGFGEVYFALSDSGKEVALKLLAEREIEMRGVLNCLNLKHPNLVHVYDVREDEHGDTWIVMEYVLGESLAQVIQRHKNGLPENLVREWFGALSRAVGHLHDQGVVHRDLKPANIFIENGGLKVGDYGLCKSLSSGQRQTQRVGTVHYMAPEIGSGKYDKSIDIYACGVMLFEMLTGKLPFDGESDNEIFMKHLTAAPDVAGLPGGFAAVLTRALDKNPLRRYTSMSEFARAVDATALPLAQAVSPVIILPGPPAPIAPQVVPVAQTVAPPVLGQPLPPDQSPIILPDAMRAAPLGSPLILPQAAKVLPAPLATAVPFSWRDRLTDLSGSLVAAPVVGGLGLVPYGLIAQTTEWAPLAKMFVMTTLLSWVVLVGSAGRSYRSADAWWPRLRFAALGLLVGLTAFWLDGWLLPKGSVGQPATSRGVTFFGVASLEGDSLAVAAKYLFYFAGVLGAGRWWRAVALDRKERLALRPLIAAGFWSGLLIFLWPTDTGRIVEGAVVPMVLATLSAQVASPWIAPTAAPARKLRLRFV